MHIRGFDEKWLSWIQNLNDSAKMVVVPLN
jgi:hypothetical protein